MPVVVIFEEYFSHTSPMSRTQSPKQTANQMTFSIFSNAKMTLEYLFISFGAEVGFSLTYIPNQV
jgi:hypothetical protein